LRLAYLGTSDFAATVLRRIAASPHRPALVVTPPDRKQGRGRKLSPPPVAIAAADLGLELHQTPSVNEPDSLSAITRAEIGVGMVCAFGQLIKPPLMETVEMLNVHPSLLPRWRGAAPIERAIMAGDAETGVAIMRLTEGLDSGPVALLERVGISSDDDYGSLAARLAGMGGELAVRALQLHDTGGLTFTEQPEEGVTYAEKIDASERRLDPARPAVELERTVRALNPHVGAYAQLEGEGRLGVVKAGAEAGGPAQGVLDTEAPALLMGTAEGALRIDVVKPAGKREMAAADYLRGNPSPRLAS
jgi:methionyl-tRNA formyltransferase